MNKSKLKQIGAWVLQVVLGLEFILAGQAKFTRPDAWERQFARWGYPDNFFYVAGALELILAILVFFPKFAWKAAAGLGIIMVVAAITHLIYGEWSRVLTTGILAVLSGLLFLLRKGMASSETVPEKA